MAQPVMSTQTFPPAAFQYAATYQLGTPTAAYRPWFRPALIFSSAALVLVGVAFLIASFTSPDPSSASALLVAGLIFIACSLIWPAIALFTRDQQVYVCTEGLAHVKGGQANAVRWDQVASVTQAVTIFTYRVFLIPVVRIRSHAYTIYRADGTRLVFKDNWRDVESLGTTIGRETRRYLLPRAIAAYDAGAPVVFGDLSVSQQGISKGGKLLPWNLYQSTQISNGAVLIRQQGKTLRWASVQIRKLPNFLVFVGLIEHIQRAQGRAGR